MPRLNRKISLVVFDLDGTLTTVDSLWRYLHEEFGTWNQGKIAAQKYKRGEISYREWAETDARYWAGVPLSKLHAAINRIPYRRGAEAVFRALRSRNMRTAIVSAGLSLLADKAAEELGADLVLSNELITNDGALTGEIRVKVAVSDKARIVEEIATQLGIPLGEVALIGDRAFDLSPPQCLRIAFEPKDSQARENADIVVEDHDLSRILQYLI
jgi:phosphoserine phosphatase